MGGHDHERMIGAYGSPAFAEAVDLMAKAAGKSKSDLVRDSLAKQMGSVEEFADLLWDDEDFDDDEWDDAPVEAGYAPLAKSENEELRFTLGPVYSPGVVDLQNEFTDAEELRKALWEFNQRGEMAVRREHGEERIGKIVELFQLPFEHTGTLTGRGLSKKQTFPAGTVYAGIVWDEHVWPEVKAGKINGLSMGGSTFRTRNAA